MEASGGIKRKWGDMANLTLSTNEGTKVLADAVRWLLPEVKKLRGEVAYLKCAMQINHILSDAQEAGTL